MIVGIGIQILEQFAGINGVLYYTPQILKEAGVEVLLANMGIGSDSASLLISVVTSLLMLPCIGVSMWLIDKSIAYICLFVMGFGPIHGECEANPRASQTVPFSLRQLVIL